MGCFYFTYAFLFSPCPSVTVLHKIFHLSDLVFCFVLVMCVNRASESSCIFLVFDASCGVAAKIDIHSNYASAWRHRVLPSQPEVSCGVKGH